jgi:PAS domain S-box-containing protein
MIGMIVVIINRDHSIETLNKKGCEVLGCDQDEVQGKNWFDLFVPERIRNDLKQSFDKIIAGEDSPAESFESVIRTTTGRELNILWHNTYLKNKGGEITAVVRSGEDITEKKQSEKRQQLINKRIGDVILLYNAEGNITSVSSSLKHILGYNEDDLIGKNIIDFVHPDDVQRVQARHHDLLLKPSRIVRSEHRVRNKRGEWIWVEGEARNLLNEPELGAILCNFRDITQRRESKEALEKSEEKYRTLVNSMAEAVAQIDLDGNIQFVNKSYCDLTGYAYDELIGQNCLTLLIDDIDELPKVQRQLASNFSGKTDHYEIRLKSKSGHYFWVSANAAPLYDNAGKLSGVLATLTDITQRKMAAEQIEQMNKEMTDFFYKSSHDLKGPLSSVRGLLELAKEDVDDEAASQYFGMISQAIDKLSSTVQQVLHTIKVRNSKTELGYIDFEQMIENVEQDLSHMPGIRNLKIHTSVRTSTRFYSDLNIMYSILQNLVENAVKYRDKSKEESWLDLSVEEYEEGIKIIAEDNGIGMSPQVQTRIFEMFFRAHADSQGTGLGLYIVKKGLEKLGGTIDVDSRENEGTRFIIYLPGIPKEEEKEFITTSKV